MPSWAQEDWAPPGGYAEAHPSGSHWLRLVAALRRTARERGGALLSIAVVDALLNQSLELTALPRLTSGLAVTESNYNYVGISYPPVASWVAIVSSLKMDLTLFIENHS